MKVKELIKKLKAANPEAEVVIPWCDEFGFDDTYLGVEFTLSHEAVKSKYTGTQVEFFEPNSPTQILDDCFVVWTVAPNKSFIDLAKKEANGRSTLRKRRQRKD